MTLWQRFSLWLLLLVERMFLRSFGWTNEDGNWSSGFGYRFRYKSNISTGHAVNAQKQSIFNHRKK